MFLPIEIFRVLDSLFASGFWKQFLTSPGGSQMTFRYPFSFPTKPLGFTWKGGFVNSAVSDSD